MDNFILFCGFFYCSIHLGIQSSLFYYLSIENLPDNNFSLLFEVFEELFIYAYLQIYPLEVAEKFV